MREVWILLGLVAGGLSVTTGCAVRYPKVIPMREQQFRSHDRPVGLPLTSQDRTEVAHFLQVGGNRFGRNTVPDAQSAGHQQALDALSIAANLTVRADLATSDFCAMAATLCQAAPIFRKRVATTQVIDARNSRPEVPEPIGVCDDEYCWVFTHENQRLAQVVVIRAVQRVKP
jgi:hypothetical protein